jgi:hypothetical protein
MRTAEGYDELDVLGFFVKALLSAQYFFMRAATARRALGVHDRVPDRCSDADMFRVVGVANFAGLADGLELAPFDRFGVDCPAGGFVVVRLAVRPACARFRGDADAISIPNIPARSSLASTFAPAGPLRVFERSDPALAINSC